MLWNSAVIWLKRKGILLRVSVRLNHFLSRGVNRAKRPKKESWPAPSHPSQSPPDETYLFCVSVSAMCWLQCQNGGVCQRPNTCSCPEGWMGRLCEERKCQITGAAGFIGRRRPTATSTNTLKPDRLLCSHLHPAVPERGPVRGTVPVRVSHRMDGHALPQR